MALTHNDIAAHLQGLPTQTQRGLHRLFAGLLDEIAELREMVQAAGDTDLLPVAPDAERSAASNSERCGQWPPEVSQYADEGDAKAGEATAAAPEAANDAVQPDADAPIE